MGFGWGVAVNEFRLESPSKLSGVCRLNEGREESWLLIRDMSWREASSSSPELFAPLDLGLDLSVRFVLKNRVLKPECNKWGRIINRRIARTWSPDVPGHRTQLAP